MQMDTILGQNSSERSDDMEVEVQATDDTDDSDMVEQDVKVCDICGDAGREELLAICSRCSDGAEHTYCMRKMLDKVPEGDWLCEECKSVESLRTERQERIVRVDESEKNNSSGQASSDYVNSSDIEGQRTKPYVKNPGKRLRDDAEAEVSSIAKKPVLEAIDGSPKTSISGKAAALSRENSFKNPDKGRLQTSLNSSSDTVRVNDPESANTATDIRVENFRGTFSKSSSFNSLNSKPKVKLVDQVIFQRQKSARDHSLFRPRAGVDKSIGKSQSFKSMNSSHSESKTKSLSPRLSQVPDIRNTKQQSPLERQSSIKTAHPSTNLVMGSVNTTSRTDKKLAFKGESSSPSTITNHHELKPVQTVGKLAGLSRSLSLAARKNVDPSRTLGEFKRPSLHHSAHRVSSANIVSNGEQKPNQSNATEDSSHCSVTERPVNNANDGLPDGLSRSRDLATSGEKMRESSGSRFRPPSAKFPRDESNNIKAAVEAAVLRKPGVCGKLKGSGQSDPSVSTLGSHQDHILDSSENKVLSSSAYPPQRQAVPRHLHSDYPKQSSLDIVKQLPLIHVKGLSFVGSDSDPMVPLETKSPLQDMFNNVPRAMPFHSKLLAIPEHEYIWQGSFEISRNGKVIESWDGVQAHISTCASPKVIETGSKFNSRILLCEVPRSSAWPVQFEEHGVREDNIALFFFAKDLESYDKIYKVLLDNMMKNDLALKGNVNGVELLLFPSNQLPENAQRWNMLFFLWGVFRGKKESYLPPMPDPIKQVCAPLGISSTIMPFAESRCSLRPISADLPASEDTAASSKAPEESCGSLSSKAGNEEYESGVSFLNCVDNKSNSGSLAALQSGSGKELEEPKGAFMDMQSTLVEEMPMQLDTLGDRQQLSHHNIYAAAAHDTSPEEGLGKRTTLERRACNQEKMDILEDSENVLAIGSIPLKEDRYTRDLNIAYSEWPSDYKELVHPESRVASQTLYPGTSQVFAGSNDMGDEPYQTYGKMNHVAAGSCVLENRFVELRDDSDILQYDESGERHFFPIKPKPVKGVPLVDGAMNPLEQVRVHGKVPNLELGLEAETKLLIEPLLVEKLDKKIDDGHILEGAGTEKDDVSACLSLSLAFPFPEKEQRTEFVPEKDSSLLLFGSLRDN